MPVPAKRTAALLVVIAAATVLWLSPDVLEGLASPVAGGGPGGFTPVDSKAAPAPARAQADYT